ncbi:MULTISPECIES: Ldh family oxidoreductase [unclassified Pyramidobacter]|uniref:Ldh family oxidoreductase n=1 Tax=unclassified Pyramidobacter TaxID=2632171 RepID=UPI000EA0DE2A|nr:Ldh family oxidoreductase [Pyramidobacter sp. CG50-2]RKJ81143.1 Ldh family oxidoreductase [Pyramidobacter sp. CG50-2]
MERVEVSLEKLQRWAEEILRGLGVPKRDAAQTVAVMMDAEISGVESHGLMRLKAYADRIAQGMIKPNPDIKVKALGAIARVDGGNGLGQVVMAKATDTAIGLAKKYGIGAVTVCRSNHFGTAAFYANAIARAECIGLAASMAGPTMAPFGGMDLLLGTNPFAVAFPGSKQTFCGDMATSATAKGKIRIFEKRGLSLPSGWALDKDGNDTTDPTEAIKGILLPMGGHKGYALAMAVDALSALLSGACLSCESTSLFSSTQPANTGHFVLAINIAHFLPEAEFEARAQEWFDRLKASRVRPGFRIMIPGEPEAEKRATAGATISILAETLDTIEAYHQKYAIRK